MEAAIELHNRMQQEEGITILPAFKLHKKKMFLTPHEFSYMYDIGINKTYELINIKDFPKIKNGNRYLIIRSKVDEWILDNIGLQF